MTTDGVDTSTQWRRTRALPGGGQVAVVQCPKFCDQGRLYMPPRPCPECDGFGWVFESQQGGRADLAARGGEPVLRQENDRWYADLRARTAPGPHLGLSGDTDGARP